MIDFGCVDYGFTTKSSSQPSLIIDASNHQLDALTYLTIWQCQKDPIITSILRYVISATTLPPNVLAIV